MADVEVKTYAQTDALMGEMLAHDLRRESLHVGPQQRARALELADSLDP